MTTLPELDYNSLVGIHINSVKAILFVYGIKYRITQRGKEHYIITMDYRPDRVNLKLTEDGIVYCLDFG